MPGFEGLEKYYPGTWPSGKLTKWANTPMMLGSFISDEDGVASTSVADHVHSLVFESTTDSLSDCSSEAEMARYLSSSKLAVDTDPRHSDPEWLREHPSFQSDTKMAEYLHSDPEWLKTHPSYHKKVEN